MKMNTLKSMQRSPEAGDNGGKEKENLKIEKLLHSSNLVGHGEVLNKIDFNPKETYNKLLEGLSKETIKNNPERGDYTLNPENQNLNFKELIPEILSNPEWQGKPIYEVLRDVCDKYSDTHYLPGIEYLQYLQENNIDCENPQIFEKSFVYEKVDKGGGIIHTNRPPSTHYFFPSSMVAIEGTYGYPVWAALEARLVQYTKDDPLRWDEGATKLYHNPVRAPDSQQIPYPYDNEHSRIVILKKETK